MKKKWMIGVAIFLTMASADALMIDSGAFLPTLNDTTASSGALTESQSFSTNQVVGGNRGVEIYSTWVNSGNGIKTLQDYFGDVGNWGAQGYVLLSYGSEGALNISANKDISVFMFDFSMVQGSPNVRIMLDRGENRCDVNNFTGDFSIAANSASWQNSAYDWSDIDHIYFEFYFDNNDDAVRMQGGSFIQLTNADVIPEPATALILALGGGIIGFYRRFFGQV